MYIERERERNNKNESYKKRCQHLNKSASVQARSMFSQTSWLQKDTWRQPNKSYNLCPKTSKRNPKLYQKSYQTS